MEQIQKKKKKVKFEVCLKDYFFGLISGMVVVVIILGLAFGPGLNNPFVRYNRLFLFDVASLIHTNDPFITETMEHCTPYVEDERGLVSCVVDYVSSFYHYEERDRRFLGRIIRSPTEIKNGETAVCRDIAIVYDGVFRRLGWVTSFILEENHIYNHVAKNETSCTINGYSWSCY